jgi:hypothetical protein
MPLPINRQTSEIMYKEYTVFDGTKIRVRSYKISDIEFYLKRIQSNDDVRVIEKATYDLIKSCTHIDDVEFLENIDRINFIYLMIQLRITTVGESMPYPYECPKCKTNHIEHRIDILPINYEYDVDKKIVFSDSFSIGLRNIPFAKELEIVDLTDENIRSRYELFYKIKYIQNDDDIYEHKLFTFQEFGDWLDSVPDNYHLNNTQFLSLIAKVNNFNDYIKIDREQVCIACNQINHLQMNNFTFFILV